MLTNFHAGNLPVVSEPIRIGQFDFVLYNTIREFDLSESKFL